MRLLYHLSFVFIGIAPTISDARPMVYDGYLTDLNDQPVEAVVNLRVALYGEQLGGDPLWEELLSEISVRNGVFSAALGTITPFPAGLFARRDLYLGLSVDGGESLSPVGFPISATLTLNAMWVANSTVSCSWARVPTAPGKRWNTKASPVVGHGFGNNALGATSPSGPKWWAAISASMRPQPAAPSTTSTPASGSPSLLRIFYAFSSS